MSLPSFSARLLVMLSKESKRGRQKNNATSPPFLFRWRTTKKKKAEKKEKSRSSGSHPPLASGDAQKKGKRKEKAKGQRDVNSILGDTKKGKGNES